MASLGRSKSPGLPPRQAWESIATPMPGSARLKFRAATPPARLGGASGSQSARSFSSARGGRSPMTPRTAAAMTKAEAERAKVERERHAAAQAQKEHRQQREQLLEQRQHERCRSVHHSASTLRANTTAAVMAQRAGTLAEKRDMTDEVKQQEESLRRARDEQRAKWRARGKQLNSMCLETRHNATRARNRVREANLMEAHRSTAERLDLFRHSAEVQSLLNDSKRLMAERVKREAGLDVVRTALKRSSAERGQQAQQIRAQSGAIANRAEQNRQAEIDAHKLAASRIELVASPERIRELRGIEHQRKSGLTGGLRRQYRAFEALALERREEEAATRQRMHDAVVCQRYGVPAGVSIDEIKLGSGS